MVKSTAQGWELDEKAAKIAKKYRVDHLRKSKEEDLEGRVLSEKEVRWRSGALTQCFSWCLGDEGIPEGRACG